MTECHDWWTATLLADGRVLVVGSSSNPNGQAGAELYDPDSDAWAAAGSGSRSGEGHTASLLPDGRLLIAGGFSDDWLAAAELFDPGSGKWSQTGSLATARGGHTATLLPDGKVLVTGGYHGATGAYGASSAAELFDPGTGEWSITGSLVAARAGHTATLLPDGRVLVTGGDASLAADGGPMLASAELYDPDTGRWTTTGSMAEARGAFTATLLPGGSVLVAGGRDSAGSVDGLASAELYDPATGRWSTTGRMAEARTNGHTATLLADGTVLVVGDDRRRSAEVYDAGTGRWRATASPIVPPNGTATLLPDGRVLVVGQGCSGASNERPTAELYDPES